MANREHKFRAWDVENNEMIDGDSLAFEEYQPLAYLLQDSEYMKFMEYTGLKDWHDNEIYEGDILYYHYPKMYSPEGCSALKIVKYENGRFEICDRLDFYGEQLDVKTRYSNDVETREYFTAPDEIKVVGNIYQNADLLIF